MRLGLLLVALSAWSQTVPPSLLQGLQWRSIGPAATGGRIADLAVSRTPGEPLKIYVATTTGGIFKSVNEGVSWTPIFDNAGGMMSIGAIAVAPSDPNIVWVGTGEADNRQSSSWGDGVYKSTDGGATWQKVGTRRDPAHRPHRDPSDRPQHRLRRGRRAPLGIQPRARRLQDHATAARPGRRFSTRTSTPARPISPSTPRIPISSTPRCTSASAKAGAINGGGPGSGIFRTTRRRRDLDRNEERAARRRQKGRIGLAVFPGGSTASSSPIVEADRPPAASSAARTRARPGST